MGRAREDVGGAAEQLRVVRVIARLNIGGPSIQAITLAKRLEDRGYATTLVRGREGPREGDMDGLAQALGVQPERIESLRRDPGLHDIRALVALMRILRRDRPHLVHTHAAKAGTLGRLAALIAPGRRPVLVHTFHGHSLTGYFSPRKAEIYRRIERWLAHRTDRLVAVSAEVRDDLVALGVAPSERFEVIPLGFDLSEFVSCGEERDAARRAIRQELSIAQDARLVTLVARLVPIKRVDRFLRAAEMLHDIENVHFLVVGDGPLGQKLRRSGPARALGDRITWTGFRRDIPNVCAGSDMVVLCSDNEGTPVSLIEAGAAGVPTVSTRVGGASTVIVDGKSGILVARDEGEALSVAIRRLLEDEGLGVEMGAAARSHVVERFSLDRLIGDIDDLYRRLIRWDSSDATV